MQLIIRLLITLCCTLALAATAQVRQRVLVMAELGGQHGAFTEAGLRWLRAQAEAMDFEMTEVSNCMRLKAGDIGSYDLIVQLNYPPYMWSEAAMREFEQAVDGGAISWVGFHHASLLGEFDGFPMWQWFSDFLGGIRFQNYIAEKADALMTVEDALHPVMAGVNPKFIVREDEWYTYDRSPRPDVHVLASVDEQTYTPASAIRMGDHPVVWTNPRKAARNVYFQIGHSASLFDNPAFVRMFTNALYWGLRRPMPLDLGHALERELERKPATATEPLPLTEGWRHEGLGSLGTDADGSLVMAMPLSTGRRANGSPDDPDYCIYGTATARLPLGGRGLEAWNRVSFDVRTDLDAGVANLNLSIDNRPWGGLGAHLVNIEGHEWQHVAYEIADIERGHVDCLRIYTDLKGRNLSRLDTVHYYIRNLRLERIERPEPTSGWLPAEGRLAYSHAGYYPDGPKQAVAAWQGTEKPFRLVDELTGETVFSSSSRLEQTSIGQFAVLDFTALRTPGLYRLHYGDDDVTEPFRIGDAALTATLWPVLSFVGAQRCGDAVADIHGVCHTDVFADHDGRSLSYGGGWHDAGDLSQQTLQTGDVAYALLEASEAVAPTDSTLATALTQEARHGLRQLLRTRFGDGWRASSIGLLHWTDGLVGTDDDIHSVRCQNLALDNFIAAAYEACGARLLADDSLRQAAIEDFEWARRKLEQGGVDTFRITMEHTYNTSAATFMAAASWSASMLHWLTGDKRYARLAARYIDYTLDCQQREGPMAGYFCRDRSLRVPIHYIHQSREQLPVQALVALCEQQPAHRHRARWEQALRLYADYLKQAAPATAPYGMAPSGVYHAAEYEADPDGFSRLHLWAPDDAPRQFDRQVAEGQPLGDERWLRRFPVWFSIFNGNEAVLLATGKAAALCGRYLGDEALVDLARQQLYWTLGQNPFCQSLIYGVGHRYPSLDSFSSGELTGAMPVGIRSLGDADVPYWPTTNNACYKEVWLTSAGKWLSLIASLAPAR